MKKKYLSFSFSFIFSVCSCCISSSGSLSLKYLSRNEFYEEVKHRLVFVFVIQQCFTGSVEKHDQTRGRLFHPISKHLEFGFKKKKKKSVQPPLHNNIKSNYLGLHDQPSLSAALELRFHCCHAFLDPPVNKKKKKTPGKMKRLKNSYTHALPCFAQAF